VARSRNAFRVEDADRRRTGVPDCRAIRLALAVCVAAIGLAGCQRSAAADRIGDPRAGAIAIDRMACGSCHRIPGIEEADGSVGPPLAHFASRQMIAGVLANSPQALVRYLEAPQEVVAGNVMPNEGLGDRQARDIAAYLYTLR